MVWVRKEEQAKPIPAMLSGEEASKNSPRFMTLPLAYEAATFRCTQVFYLCSVQVNQKTGTNSLSNASPHTHKNGAENSRCAGSPR
jgi:hypothetical protein